jgi:hypothetical protein
LSHNDWLRCLNVSGNVSIDNLEWGDHYLWRILSSVVVTGFVAFLAGAIAKKKGEIVAVVSNLPSVLLWLQTLRFHERWGSSEHAQIGFIVVAVIAIPVTTIVAYYFGRIGCENQNRSFSPNSILGIHPYHWAWIVLPLWMYTAGLVLVAGRLIIVQILTWRETGIVSAIIFPLSVIPVVAWIMPQKLVYDILSRNTLGRSPAAIRALAVTSVIGGGVLLAYGVQVVCEFVLGKLASWWS